MGETLNQVDIKMVRNTWMKTVFVAGNKGIFDSMGNLLCNGQQRLLQTNGCSFRTMNLTEILSF